MQKMESLIDALRRGEPGAKDLLVERLYPRVREVVHRKLQADFRRNHGWILAAFSTGDIVQEVFLRIVDGLDQFQGRDEAALTRYLATSVHNRLLDLLRYHGAARRSEKMRAPQGDATGATTVEASPGPMFTPSRHIIAREHLQIYQVVVQTFADKQRTLLRLRLEEGLAFDEIARRLDYASADVACKAFHEVLARLLVRLRTRGVKPTRTDA